MNTRNERGFALAGAILGLVVIASLIAGAFFSAHQELKIGQNSQTFQRAFDAAEAGLDAAVASWNASSYNNLAVGDSATLTGTVENAGTYRSAVRRLNDELFLIRSTGTDTRGVSQRTLAQLVRLQFVAIDINAGLTTRGSLKLGGSSYIDGVDVPPASWSGCATTGLDTLPGILTRDSSQIETSGCSNFSCVRGDPKVQNDPSINDSTFFSFGDINWDELVSMRTITIPAGTGTITSAAPVGTSTTCVINPDPNAYSTNWGEPQRTAPYVAGCINHFPIIYAAGNLKITGGRGQGILLVNGDLEVQGGFKFFGPVIVRGSLRTAGTGGHFNGGVMAANVDLEQSSVLGDAVIRYSSCAVIQATQANSPGRMLRQRAWAEITF
ncbi:MAG TPA: hypothetical protein VNL98_13645 [Gemmatimonadales bacterium]|nr:hypothetical protein [Gemmatimonadales bacterium]